jgi:hypothetical protein
MSIRVAYKADWNDIKPMGFIVSVMVMIILCLIAAEAQQETWMNKPSSPNGRMNCASGLELSFATNTIALATHSSFFRPSIPGLSGFSLSALLVAGAAVLSIQSAFFRFWVTAKKLVTLGRIFVTVIPSPPPYFVFFCSLVSASSFAKVLLALLGLSIFLNALVMADFAPIVISVFRTRIFIELRERFTLLASAALLRYDMLRHNRFSLNGQRLCLGPIGSTLLPVGSPYFIELKRIVKPGYIISIAALNVAKESHHVAR